MSFPCVKVSLTWCWGTAGQHSLDHLRVLNWTTNVHLFFALCCLVLYIVPLGKQTENSNEVYVVHLHKLQHQLNLLFGGFLSVCIYLEGSTNVFSYYHNYHEFPIGELAALHTTSAWGMPCLCGSPLEHKGN